MSNLADMTDDQIKAMMLPKEAKQAAVRVFFQAARLLRAVSRNL